MRNGIRKRHGRRQRALPLGNGSLRTTRFSQSRTAGQTRPALAARPSALIAPWAGRVRDEGRSEEGGEGGGPAHHQGDTGSAGRFAGPARLPGRAPQGGGRQRPLGAARAPSEDVSVGTSPPHSPQSGNREDSGEEGAAAGRASGEKQAEGAGQEEGARRLTCSRRRQTRSPTPSGSGGDGRRGTRSADAGAPGACAAAQAGSAPTRAGLPRTQFRAEQFPPPPQPARSRRGARAIGRPAPRGEPARRRAPPPSPRAAPPLPPPPLPGSRGGRRAAPLLPLLPPSGRGAGAARARRVRGGKEGRKVGRGEGEGSCRGGGGRGRGRARREVRGHGGGAGRRAGGRRPMWSGRGSGSRRLSRPRRPGRGGGGRSRTVGPCTQPARTPPLPARPRPHHEGVSAGPARPVGLGPAPP